MDGTSSPRLVPFAGNQKSEIALYRPKERVSLIIPAWNEEDTITQAIREADSALKAIAGEYEIIIVDDGSTDRTQEVVLAEAVENPAVRIVQFGENRGYGAALRSGFEAANYELVAFTDADCQFDLNDLEYILPLTERYDIVSGYRIDRKDSIVRRFYSWVYNSLVQLLLGSPTRDIDCALKVFHRHQLTTLLPESDNFFANTEILSKARANGLSIVDVGVRHRPRAAGHSKVSIKAIPGTLRSLLPFWWTHTLFAGGNRVAERSNGSVWPALAIVIAVSAFMLFRNLGYPLLEPDEGRYAEIAREMVVSGDWVVPRFLHKPYLDKPPMFYWLCAGSFRLFGTFDWAARLVPATAAFLTAICTFLFGRRMLGLMPAFLGTLLLTLSFGFVCCGRFLILDSVMGLFVVASLFAAYEATRGDRLRWFWWLASAIVCGLGVLTKGPVGLLLLVPPVMGHAWLNKLRVQPRFTQWVLYAAVAFCVAAPWYVIIAIRDPSFAKHFFWEHNVVRFLSGVQHPHPVWYYVPITILSWMPWGLLLLPLAVFLFARSKSLSQLRPTPLGYLVLWAGWCLLFFSASAGKLPPYILPAFAPIALLLGFMLTQIFLSPSIEGKLQGLLDRLLRHGMLLFCVAGCVLSVGMGVLQWDGAWTSALKTFAWILVSIGIVRFRNEFTPRVVVGVCASLAFVTLGILLHQGVPAWASWHAALPASRSGVALELRNSEIPIICYDQDWGSVPFYLMRDEIEYFDSNNPQRLTNFVDQNGQAYLILDHSVSLNTIQTLLPPGASISTTSVSPKATILFVQTVEKQAAMPQQSFAGASKLQPF